MTDPFSIAVLANSTLTFLMHHSPWLADKVGGAVLTQSVRETWDMVKSKVTGTREGRHALEQLETDSPPQVESLKPFLVAALQSDPGFAAQLSRLVVAGSDSQTVFGDGNKLAKVTGSENVKISIS